MHRPIKVLVSALLPALLACASVACDDRSAEQKGRDYADEKVGFAEGAAKVLEEKGKGLGTSVAKGVGDLVKGAGSATKDVIHPTVEVALDEAVTTAGVKLLTAHEGESRPDARVVVVSLSFAKAFEARLLLTALGEDGAELARATTEKNVVQAAESQEGFALAFPADTRLSKVSSYRLERLAAKAVTLDAALEGRGLALSQLKEEGPQVTIYIVFEKAYRGGLQLRAQDAGGKELGRSGATEALKQGADSATFLSFDFDARAPLATAATYTLHAAKPRPSAEGEAR